MSEIYLLDDILKHKKELTFAILRKQSEESEYIHFMYSDSSLCSE